ncbi:MAG: carbohydrate ABC transporter substrate-binding protein [Syntrophobacterales bacterium]|nr:MAG: carbohydrate ABC transporter substrate-binding protein [Syntrophobacterales bacterium]
MKSRLAAALGTFLSFYLLLATPVHLAQADVVNVIGTWSGSELKDFQDVVSPWEKKTGHTMAFVSTRDLNAVLTTRLEAGDPPEMAILPNPGFMYELAGNGKLVALDTILDMNRIKKDYARTWLDLGRYQGKLYAIFYKASSKGTIWYSPKNFKAKGYSVPKTWEEMITLSNTILSQGGTPFVIGAESGAATGWPLTDWIEIIVLNQFGPEIYDKWVNHEIPWTDPAIRRAFETLGKIVHTQGYVYGGSVGVLATNFINGTYVLYTTPPGAYMNYLGGFAQGFIKKQYPNLRPGEDYAFFPFPTIDPRYAGGVTGGADVIVLTKDTPGARSFIRFLSTPKAQEIWAKKGGFIASNKSVKLDTYPDAIAKQMALQLANAKIFRFDGSDLMPAEVNDSFWKATVEYVNNPAGLEKILKYAEEVAMEAYEK